MRISDWSSDVCSSDLVEILLQRQVLAACIERGVEVRELLQGGHAGLNQEGKHGQLGAGLLVFIVERLAQRFQVGDVGVVVLGAVRDTLPIAGEVARKNVV